MVGRRHPRRIRIPVQQIERRGRLSLEIIADDIGPDQIVRAQHVEGHRHLAAFEHARRLHVALERRDLALVDEHQKIAGVTEIDLRGQECRRRRAHAPLFCKPGQRRGEQGAADAIAHGVDFQLAGSLLDDVHRRQRAFLHIVVEGFRPQALVRVDPGNHEHRDALIDTPFDEGFFRLEIEDIEFVDPRRHDQQRGAQHVFRCRLILDQLHQLILEDHLARRRRHVDADREIGGIGLTNPQRAVSGLDIFRQHLHAADEVVAVGRQRLAQYFRIGENEIRWR